MRIVAFSDAHGNKHALDAVPADCRRQTAARAIESTDLPDEFAEALRRGGR